MDDIKSIYSSNTLQVLNSKKMMPSLWVLFWYSTVQEKQRLKDRRKAMGNQKPSWTDRKVSKGGGNIGTRN